MDNYGNNIGQGNGQGYIHQTTDGQENKLVYKVDLVFCIDCTGSMKKLIDTVKTNALNFYRDVTSAMDKKHKQINQLRVRIIAFRDYKADGKNAMLVTDFFKLPEQTSDFEKCVNSLNADGGGDIPENGLEALAYAIKSKWDTEATKGRQIIVMWTDAPTHPLGHGNESEFYPSGMAKDLQELSEWWGSDQQKGFIDSNAKRLLLFAPDLPHWNVISENWDNVLHFPSEAGDGLEKLEYSEILDVISNSI